MVVAYHVGRCVKKGKHNIRTVEYIKANMEKGSHDARVDRHKKVKTTVWGGLDKDRQPKAPTARAAKLMVKNINKKKANMPTEKAAVEAAAGGRRLRVSARKHHYYNTTVERLQRPPPAQAPARRRTQRRRTAGRRRPMRA